jgi:predicted enzyme related to lactoylglutathione lyase
MISKVNCVELPVSNMVKSMAFYEEILGLEKSYEHPTWTSFELRGTSLALAVSGTKVSNRDEEICRSCALCVLRYTAYQEQQQGKPTACSVIYLSVEDLDSYYQELVKKGVKFISEPQEQTWGGKTAVMLDPDQNILVLSEET